MSLPIAFWQQKVIETKQSVEKTQFQPYRSLQFLYITVIAVGHEWKIYFPVYESWE